MKTWKLSIYESVSLSLFFSVPPYIPNNINSNSCVDLHTVCKQYQKTVFVLGLCFPLCWPYSQAGSSQPANPTERAYSFPITLGKNPAKVFYKPCVDHLFIPEPDFTTKLLRRSDWPGLGRVSSGAKGWVSQSHAICKDCGWEQWVSNGVLLPKEIMLGRQKQHHQTTIPLFIETLNFDPSTSPCQPCALWTTWK